MTNINLNETNDPNDVAKFLRDLAAQYQQDALELQAMWQDNNAGRVWAKLAETLEPSAAKCDKIVERYFV
jgi:hypothetical protein